MWYTLKDFHPFETLPTQLAFMYPLLVIGSWFHKKFHTTKCASCTSICISLHPNVVFEVFA
jgi:hypothetical protein